MNLTSDERAALERLQAIKQRFDAARVTVLPAEDARECDCPLCGGEGILDTTICDTAGESGFGYIGIQAFGIGQKMLATTEFVSHLDADMRWLLERAALQILRPPPAPPAAESDNELSVADLLPRGNRVTAEGSEGKDLPDDDGVWRRPERADIVIVKEVQRNDVPCLECIGWVQGDWRDFGVVDLLPRGNWRRVPAQADAELRAEVDRLREIVSTEVCQCRFDHGKIVQECHYHECCRTVLHDNGDPSDVTLEEALTTTRAQLAQAEAALTAEREAMWDVIWQRDWAVKALKEIAAMQPKSGLYHGGETFFAVNERMREAAIAALSATAAASSETTNKEST